MTDSYYFGIRKPITLQHYEPRNLTLRIMRNMVRHIRQTSNVWLSDPRVRHKALSSKIGEIHCILSVWITVVT